MKYRYCNPVNVCQVIYDCATRGFDSCQSIMLSWWSTFSFTHCCLLSPNTRHKAKTPPTLTLLSTLRLIFTIFLPIFQFDGSLFDSLKDQVFTLRVSVKNIFQHNPPQYLCLVHLTAYSKLTKYFITNNTSINTNGHQYHGFFPQHFCKRCPFVKDP